MRNIIIKDEIFEKFPEFKRGIIIIKDISNEPSNTYIQELLDQIIEDRKYQSLLESPKIQSWEKIHSDFGSNPNRFMPSIKSLIKRIPKGLPFINSVVAAMNYISLKYLLSVGGDDIDKIKGNLILGKASGHETFIPLGSNEVEHPFPGEVIYFDDVSLNIMCRRWNWRNGDFTKITPESKHIVINIDGTEAVSQSEILDAQNELVDILKNFKASLDVEYLNKEKKMVKVNL